MNLGRVVIPMVLLAFFASPKWVVAQDLFLSFGQGADVSLTNETQLLSDNSGSAFLYVRNGFDVLSLDLVVSSSDDSVLELTSGTLLNSNVGSGATRFLAAGAGLDADGTLGLLALALGDTDFFPVASLGVRSVLSGTDEGFDPVAIAFLLGEINYNIVGEGVASLEISYGLNDLLVPETPGPIVLNPDGDLPGVLVAEEDVALGAATLTVVTAVPEPSTVGLLAFGFVGILVRRKR